MRASAADRLLVGAYGLGLVAAGRLLGSEAHPLVGAMVPASVIMLGLVLPVAPASLKRTLTMLAGGTFILGASSGALLAAGGASTVAGPRWLAVLVPALYLLTLSVGLPDDSAPRVPATPGGGFPGGLVVSGVLVWGAAAAILLVDAATGTPPTPNDALWLAGAGASLVVAGGWMLHARRARRTPVRQGSSSARPLY
ncbi:MAG TPA: hypothetical protein VGB42_09220 [Candidatus Thermoplasmatota archaeon]